MAAPERKGVWKHFVRGRLDETFFNIRCDADDDMDDDHDTYALKRALQFYQQAFLESEEEKSLTFCIDTDEEKLMFANWVIEEKLGDFRQENTHIFISELHVSTVGQLVNVPIAEHVSSG
tara:strand:+ start:847 stop:1206 length:360 start_codon:yes stop_codon:yes gene_type:complete